MMLLTEKIDVFIPTYNSEIHLQECINSVRKAFPIRRIVIIDHHSTDGTRRIAQENDCQVLLEDKGLAYVRELTFKMAESEFFAMVESDLVYHQFDWYERARSLLKGNAAAVVAFVPRSGGEVRGRYNEFWSRYTPMKDKKHGFSAGSTLMKRDAVQGMKLPERLQAYEDIYILRSLQSRGLTYRWIEVNGVHYSDFGSFKKARWYGANARILYSMFPGDLTLIRRYMALPLKGAIASLLMFDPSILSWSIGFALSFLRGWNNPERFSVLNR
jgi:glycosyltransferase involved in cell wall biosynthesis